MKGNSSKASTVIKLFYLDNTERRGQVLVEANRYPSSYILKFNRGATTTDFEKKYFEIPTKKIADKQYCERFESEVKNYLEKIANTSDVSKVLVLMKGDEDLITLNKATKKLINGMYNLDEPKKPQKFRRTKTAGAFLVTFLVGAGLAGFLGNEYVVKPLEKDTENAKYIIEEVNHSLENNEPLPENLENDIKDFLAEDDDF